MSKTDIKKRAGEFTAMDGMVWFFQAIPVTEEGGKIIGVLEMCRDIKEKKNTDDYNIRAYPETQNLIFESRI